MGQSPEPKPKVPLWKILLRWGEGLSILGGLGTAARWFLKAVAGVSVLTTILTSPFAIYTYGLLIIVGGLLIGGAVIRYGYEQSQRSPSPTPPPTATATPIPTATPSPTPTRTPTPTPAAPSAPAAKPPLPRPGVTANVILHRSVTEHLHTDDGGPGPAKPPSATAKSTTPPQVTATAPPPVVEVRPAGRVLTAEQRATLKSNLTSLNGHHIGVYSDWNDEESGKYGYQFFTLFQSAGIDVGLMVGKEMRTAPPPPLSIEVYTDVPVNENTVEIQDALTLRGALVAARLMDPATKINVIPKATLTGGKNEVHLMLGPRAAVAQ